jgi:glucose-1-phosphate adenylyltransferase
VIEGEVENCILFPGVRVGRGASIRDSILMSGTTVGDETRVDRAIIDKNCRIDRACVIGSGPNTLNEEHPNLLDTGITVIGKSALLPQGTTLGRNVLVDPDVAPLDLPGSEIASGATIHRRPLNRREVI